MPAATTLISVEEYLNTVYRPDRDYIEGEVLERNMGETPHVRLQNFFIRYLSAHEDDWNVEVLPEQRVQVGERRFRIPDVMLASIPNPDPLLVRTPPILCVEILSSKDRMKKVQERIDDYARMGVRAIWVIDLWHRIAFAAGPDAVLHQTTDRLTVEGAEIAIIVQEIFAELDRFEKPAVRKTL